MPSDRSLDSYTIYLPDLPGDVWSAELKQAEGADRTLLLHQTRLVNLASGVPDRSMASPERLAWICMWSKAMRFIHAARSCWERNNDVAIRILGRPAFELSLHVWTVLKPALMWQELKRKAHVRLAEDATTPAAAWQEVLERLCAYATWCIFGDLDLLSFLLRKDVRRDAWDPSPIKELLKDPNALTVHQVLSGVQLDIRNDHELERDREAWEGSLKADQKRLKRWLEHDRLQRWVQAYRQFREDNDKVPPSFFRLCGEDESSVRKHLRARGVGFAYFEYKRGSMLAHAGSIEEVTRVRDDVIVPTFTGWSDEVGDQAASEIAAACAQVAIGLYLLQERVWRDDGDRS